MTIVIMAEYIDNVWNIIHTKLGHDPGWYIENELIPRYNIRPSFHPLLDLFANRHDVILFPVLVNYNKYIPIYKEGDIFVGIYTREKVTISMTIGGRNILDSHTMYPGEFIFPHEKRYMIPIISSAFNQIQIYSDDNDGHNIILIYAWLDTDERRYMAMNSLYCHIKESTYGVYKFGAFVYETIHDIKQFIEDSGIRIRIPDSSIVIESCRERERKRVCIEQTQCIKKELMENTWHPRRFTSWCLEYDDIFFCLCLSGKKPETF